METVLACAALGWTCLAPDTSPPTPLPCVGSGTSLRLLDASLCILQAAVCIPFCLILFAFDTAPVLGGIYGWSETLGGLGTLHAALVVVFPVPLVISASLMLVHLILYNVVYFGSVWCVRSAKRRGRRA